jgi:hypothetical protein
MKLSAKVNGLILSYIKNRQSIPSKSRSFLQNCVNDYFFDPKNFFVTIKQKFSISFFKKNLIVISQQSLV